MKRIISFSSIILSSILLFSFSSVNQWKTYKSINGVNIYYKTANCNTEYNKVESEYYVFKYKNTNNYSVRLSWKLNVWVNDLCRSCNLPSPNEYELSLDIKAGQTLEYNCNDNSKAFKLFKTSKAVKTKDNIRFEFTQIMVSKLD